MGYVLKLLAIAKRDGNTIEVRVHPTFLPQNHPLSSVDGSFNAVYLHGHACQEMMLQGRGAGDMPTASAVMGDVLDVMGNMVHSCCGRVGCTCYKNLPVKKEEDAVSRYFLRVQVSDRPGALANIAGVLGNNNVSIAQVYQKRSKNGVAELVIITDRVKERDFNDSLTVVKGISVMKEISSVIRVY